MTEQEARQKWCPFVRMTVKPSTMLEKLVIGNNRGEAASEKGDVCSTACIASECMSWRKLTRPDFSKEIDATTGWYPDYEDDEGYCGLAGKP